MRLSKRSRERSGTKMRRSWFYVGVGPDADPDLAGSRSRYWPKSQPAKKLARGGVACRVRRCGWPETARAAWVGYVGYTAAAEGAAMALTPPLNAVILRAAGRSRS